MSHVKKVERHFKTRLQAFELKNYAEVLLFSLNLPSGVRVLGNFPAELPESIQVSSTSNDKK